MRKIHWINGALALLLVGLIVADEVVPYVDTTTGKVWPPAVEARIKTGESVQSNVLAAVASGYVPRFEFNNEDWSIRAFHGVSPDQTSMNLTLEALALQEKHANNTNLSFLASPEKLRMTHRLGDSYYEAIEISPTNVFLSSQVSPGLFNYRHLAWPSREGNHVLATEEYVADNYFSKTDPVLFVIGEESVTLSVDGLSIENGAEDFIRLDSGFTMFADDTMVTITEEGRAIGGAAALKLSIWDKWDNRNNGISFHTFGLSLFDSAPPYPETHWDFRREAGTFQPAAMSDLSAAISQVNWPSEDIATNIIWSVVVSNGHWLIYGEAKP